MSLGVLAGCSGRHVDAAPDAGSSECQEYVAAYQACFDKLGPEARAAGARILGAARERLNSANADEALRARCRQGVTQLASACR